MNVCACITCMRVCVCVCVCEYINYVCESTTTHTHVQTKTILSMLSMKGGIRGDDITAPIDLEWFMHYQIPRAKLDSYYENTLEAKTSTLVGTTADDPALGLFTTIKRKDGDFLCSFPGYWMCTDLAAEAQQTNKKLYVFSTENANLNEYLVYATHPCQANFMNSGIINDEVILITYALLKFHSHTHHTNTTNNCSPAHTHAPSQVVRRNNAKMVMSTLVKPKVGTHLHAPLINVYAQCTMDKGEEIFVDYGANFWTPQLQAMVQNAPCPSFTTTCAHARTEQSINDIDAPHYKKHEQRTLIRYKMRTHLQSPCPALMITKDMYEALHNHTKIATRRSWNEQTTLSHTRALLNQQLVRVWSRKTSGSLYGSMVGHVRYTHTYEQRLDQMTAYDVMLEGFPSWTVAQFHEEKFRNVAKSTVVRVFMFMFYPSNHSKEKGIH
jgi:hypothetical protein